MSYVADVSKLTKEQIEYIKKFLVFQPVSLNKKFANNAPPVTFYSVKDGKIRLPYIFASSLLKIIPNTDHEFTKTKITFKGQLRPNQEIVEKEAYFQLMKFGTVTLGLHPGFGKTILSTHLTSKLNLLTVVLTHREILNTQWKTSFSSFTDAKTWIVGEEPEPEDYQIIICMDKRFNLIKNKNKIGLLIIDEAHAFCTSGHVECLLSWEPKFIILLSGTLERDDELHKMAHVIASERQITRESNIPFKVIKTLTLTKPERIKVKGTLNYSHLVETTLIDDRRNQIILKLVNENLNHKILILTCLKLHAENLRELLDSQNLKCDTLYGKKKEYIDCNILIGTTSKIGTGFDPATSCSTYDGNPFDLLILVCSIKKYSALVQNVGRVFRAQNPVIYHFVDDDNIYETHWKKAAKWYKSRGGEVSVRKFEEKIF